MPGVALLTSMLLTALLVWPPWPRAVARTILAATPISRMDLAWWRHRFEQKAAHLRQGHVDLVFYGNSITQDWERHGPPPWLDFAPVWQRFYGDRNAVNLGFVGDTTANLLWRIERGEAQGTSPKVAVILIGANNMGRPHWPAGDTLAGIDRIIAELRQRLPQTKLLLLSVLPSDRSEWVTEATQAVNTGLKARYGGNRTPDVTYIDLTLLFMQGGTLNHGAFLDPKLKPPEPALHPDAAAQARMAEAIEPTLATLMRDHVHKGGN